MLINIALLARLVAELEELDAAPVAPADAERRREDLHYTLCVATGVRDHVAALTRARLLLAARAAEATAAA